MNGKNLLAGTRLSKSECGTATEIEMGKIIMRVEKRIKVIRKYKIPPLKMSYN